MLIIAWFSDIKKAKAMAIIMGVVTSLILLTSIVLFAHQYYKTITYIHIEAVITDFRVDTRDTNNRIHWTEYEYSIDNKDYSIRIDQYLAGNRVGKQVSMLANPNNHSQVEIVHDNPYLMSVVALVGAGIFGVFFILYSINYLSLRKKQQLP